MIGEWRVEGHAEKTGRSGRGWERAREEKEEIEEAGKGDVGTILNGSHASQSFSS